MSPAAGAVRLPDSSSANTPRMWPPLAVCHTLIAVHCPAGTSIRKMSFGSGFSTRAESGCTPPAAVRRPSTVQTWRSSRPRPVLGRQKPANGPSTVRSHIPIARLA